MGKLRIFALIILLAMAVGAGSGLIYGQSYAVYPLTIYGEHADLAADNSNNLHIIWLRYGTLYYGRIVNNAVTGTQTVPGTTNLVAVHWSWPHIAKSPSGDTVHVLWVGGDHKKLFHSWRNSSGTWTTETVRTSTYNQFYWPVCSVDAAGNVHAVYGNSPGDGNCDIFYTIKNVAGSWSTPVEISGGDTHLNTTNPDFNENDMFSDPNGGIHVKWSLINTRYLRYRYCASGGSLASSPTEYIVDNSAISVGPGDIYVENNGTVHLGFNAYNGNVNIDHSYKLAGGSWTAPTRARTAADTAHEIWPTIAAPRDGSNRVFTAWAEGTSLMKMAVKDGSSWTLYDLDTAAGMNDDWIRAAMTVTDSAVYGIWRTGAASSYSWVLGVVPTRTMTLTAPNGGESWIRTTSHNITWNSNGVTGTVKLLLYQNLSLIGTIAQDLAVGTGTYSWTVGNMATGSAPAGSNYKVRVQTTDGTLSDDSDGTFTIVSEIENVSTPNTPAGSTFGISGVSYAYSSSGAVSSQGHSVQYKFDWGDGSDSDWLNVGTTSASHSWSSTGTFSVRTMARCSLHTTIESPWSTTLNVSISIPGGFYNSPTSRQILPEVIWAPATGGGTWVSDVQVVDLSGGSQVTVYYNTAAGRRGPFLLWNNIWGSALSSVKYANLLQTIDGLDSGPFIYNGTVGAVEFATQDSGHLIHVTVRQLNGNCAKNSTALSQHLANTAATGRNMIIPNLANNATYRTTCGFYNPTADAVTMELKLLGVSGAQAGSTVSKTLAGYGFMSFNPFTEAGLPYPGNSYDNVKLKVEPTTGSGSVMCFGATANNLSNDPAAHVAVQASGYDNGPSNYKILPEVIWAPATGGGTWVSDVQVVDMSGGSQVMVYYNTAAGRRGPFMLWNNSGGSALSSVKYANLLQTIDGLDSGAFAYNGTVGAVEFATQDGSHLIHVAVRELNGNFTKTFPGLNLVNAETAGTERLMIITNLVNNATYRTTCGFYNPTASSVTVQYTLQSSSGGQIGSAFSRTLAGYGFTSFNPFIEAGVPYPGSSYDNVKLKVEPTTGSGSVMCFGATANNTSNDPASHLAVQRQ